MPLLCAFLLALQTPAPATSQLPDTAHVVIVATTDVHGRVLGWDYVRDAEAPGGLSRAATILETLRAQYPGAVVAVDAGDLIQGNPFATYFATQNHIRPNPVVDAVNALQYDVATPGNHEFDFGLAEFQNAAADATFQYVSANIVKGPGDTLALRPIVVVVRGGVKIGVTGFTTPGVNVWDRAQLGGQWRVRRIAQAAPAAMRALDSAGVDVKVALIHSGLGGASSYDTSGVGPENDAAALAAVNPRPDLVIVGHTHGEIRDTVLNGVHFVQPKNFAQGLAVIHLWLKRSGTRWAIDHLRSDLIPLATTPELPRFTRRLESAQAFARSWGATTLGTAGPGFGARMGRAEDTPLLDFINEVQRRRAGAELSAAADVDTGAGFPEGEIHLRDVAGVYPYDNTLRAVRISGAQLKAYLEQSARYYRTYVPGRPIVNDSVPGFDFDVVSGVEYALDLTAPAGSRVRSLAFRGRPVAPSDSFTLALSSYRQTGGGGYSMLAGARVVYDRGEDIRDLLVQEIRRAGTLSSAGYFVSSWSILPPARDAARAAFTPAPPPVTVADSTVLRVLSINDLHGALEPRTWPWSGGRNVGGAAALKPWLDSLAKDCGCTSIRLDGGDEMQGTPISNFVYGRPVIAAMNRLGIDAAAIGNHEFDWGVDTLRARMAEARYRFLAANITDTTGTARPDWALPWTVIQRGGLKIAVIGLALEDTPTETRADNVRGLAFGAGAAAVRRTLPEARKGADFVIVLAHEGAFCDSTCHGDIVDVARGLDSGSVDLIVSAHTHSLVNTVVHGIPIVQARSSGAGIAVVDFVRQGTTRQVRARIETPFTDQVQPDTAIEHLVARAEARVDTITSRPIANFKFDLKRDGDEYPLGRLLADGFREMGRGDFAIINNGSIRTDLAAGTATYGTLFQLQPFQNRLLRLHLAGATVKDVLEHVVREGRPSSHVAGLEFWYDPSKPAGQRVTKVQLWNGKKLDPRATYTLVVTDFLAGGGSGFAMLKDLPSEDAGLVDLDALIRYLQALPQPVVAPASERIHAERK